MQIDDMACLGAANSAELLKHLHREWNTHIQPGKRQDGREVVDAAPEPPPAATAAARDIAPRQWPRTARTATWPETVGQAER